MPIASQSPAETLGVWELEGEWIIPLPKFGNGRGMEKKQFPKFGNGKKTISKIREWEENENDLFPKIGNGKGLKKSIPNSIQRQSFPGIAGNGNSNGKKSK